MNRILFERDEIKDGVVTFDDVRAEHVLNVLHGEVGQILKTGEVDGPIGTGEIVELSNRRMAESGASGPAVTVRCSHTEASRKPWVDLILAPPRPRVMKRLLPQLATMGVGRIILVGAKKVEKDFWGATLLKPENYRPLLIDGLMQAGTSVLPRLETRRNFRKFVKEELDMLFPASPRIVAHPYNDAFSSHSTIRRSDDSPVPPPLLAIGPEGGWTDDEVALMEEHGFTRYSLGSRILRTDTATIALLAQLMKDFDR